MGHEVLMAEPFVFFQCKDAFIFANRLDAIGLRAVRARPAMEVVFDSMLQFAKGQFETHGALGSEVWKPLATSTIEDKTSRGMPFPAAPLIAEGDLSTSLSINHAPHQIRLVDDEQAAIGTDLEYFQYHQSDQPRTSNLPRRPVFDFNAKTSEGFANIAGEWIFFGALGRRSWRTWSRRDSGGRFAKNTGIRIF